MKKDKMMIDRKNKRKSKSINSFVLFKQIKKKEEILSFKKCAKLWKQLIQKEKKIYKIC